MTAVPDAAAELGGRRQPQRVARVGHRWVGTALVVVVLAIAVVAGRLIADSQAGRERLIADRFGTRHTTAIHFMESYVAQIQARQRELGTSVLRDRVTSARFDEIARQNLFASAVLLDEHGRLLAVSPPDRSQLGTPVGDSYGYLRLAVGGTATVSDVVSATGTREPVVDFAVPFPARSGRRVLSTGYAITSTPLHPFVVSALSTYRSAEVYLVDSGGTVIISNRPTASGRLLERVSPALSSKVNRAEKGFLGQGTDRRFFMNGPVKGTGWHLVFALDTAELFSTVTPAQRKGPWAALLGFLLMALGLVALFTRALAARSRAEGEHARQEAILDMAGDAFIGMDAGGLITDWNLAAARLLGWSRAEALGQSVAALIVPAAQREAHLNGLRDFLTTGTVRLPLHPITLTAQHRDGHQIPVELIVSRTRWEGTWRFHGFLRDITGRLEHEQQLTDLALTDSLTGLANRRAFLDRLGQALARSRRHDTPIGVVYADVDHFKAINDTYGHAAGDAILRDVADRMRALFRTEDSVGRLGGDEFAVVCEDFDAPLDEIITRVRQVLANPYSFRGQPILATVSIGVAIPNRTETIDELLERADASMYTAKATHRS